MISKTDARKVVRYLRDASAYYKRTAGRSLRIEDRARLMRLLADKIERKLKRNKDEEI